MWNLTVNCLVGNLGGLLRLDFYGTFTGRWLDTWKTWVKTELKPIK